MNPESLTEAEIASLLPAVAEIEAVLDPEALFPAIAQQLRGLVKYDSLALYLGTPETALRLVHRAGEVTLGLPGTPVAEQIRESANGAKTILREADGAHVLAQPLVRRGRLIGVLALGAKASRTFGKRGVTLVQMMAGNLATAIENSTLYKDARWYAGLLAMLYDAGKEMGSILNLDALCERVADIVKRVIDYEMFAIFLVDEKSQELVLRTARQMSTIAPRRRIRLSEGLTGAAASSKEPILVPDVHADPRYIAVEPDVRSELVIPLLNKDRVVGVFDLESREANRFTHEHIKVLTPLASQVAVAIENARLVDDIVRRDNRMKKELRIAQQIQDGLFPEECPQGEGWSAVAHFLPARELAGDLYDFYELGEGRVGIAIGDVSGKGVPAALFGAFASGTIRARAFQRLMPAELLTRANRALYRRTVDGLFCTVTYALFDLQSRQARIAGSGLPYAFHYRARDKKSVPIEIPGIPLALFDDSQYDEAVVPLESGDVFLFHTDGVTEAWNGQEQLGSERLRAMLDEHGHKSTPDVGRAIEHGLRRFAGENLASDDVTFVVVRIL